MGLQIVQPVNEAILSVGGYTGSGHYHTEHSDTPLKYSGDYWGGFVSAFWRIPPFNTRLSATYLHGNDRLEQEVLPGWLLSTKFQTHVLGVKTELLYPVQRDNWELTPYLAFTYWRVIQTKAPVKVNDTPVFEMEKSHQSFYQLPVGVKLKGNHIFNKPFTEINPLFEVSVTPTWGERQRNTVWKSRFRNVASVDVVEPEIDQTSISGSVGIQITSGQLNSYFRYRVNKSQHLKSGQFNADFAWRF